MPELDSIFHQVAALLALSAVIAFIANRLRQPLVVGFIAAGIVVGPEVLGLVEEPEELELLANIGIALLLFVVGLKLDLRLVRVVGPVALATGLGQVIFTSGVGYLIAIGLGMQPVTALYVAVALTFSSTIIIVKLLSDKGEIDDLHGRIAIGFLIVQDIVVVLAMIAITAFGEPAEQPLTLQFVEVFATGIAFLGGLLILMRWVLPPLMRKLSHSPEVLLLFAIAWAVFLASVGELLGFSEEVGAFLAGVSLASTPYRDALGARLVSLRDFLLLFFFITLGAQLDFAEAGAQIGAAIVFSLFVLIGNPIIVMIIMGVMGYPTRVSFRAGLTVAQISEFSLILVALGFTLGHIDSETVGLVTTVGLITIGLSTYLIYNSGRLYDRFAPILGVFERSHERQRIVHVADDTPEVDVIVFGLGRYGSRVVEILQEHGWSPLGVDFDPQGLRSWEQRGLPIAYGDAHDPHVPEVLPLERARWVVSTIRDLDTNLSLVQTLRQHGYERRIAVSALSDADAEILADAGADKVLRPFHDAAADAVSALEQDRRAGEDEAVST